ncbi:Na+/H+ antiporter NhaA [Motiliproteus sp. MSK22-1]|uniref:Na+/H+ antiporter NhaA n=1 Tax=Motiliproteus sp. MSK22-1 TaxID=1897630 RepID=UPI000978187C|nr:Na+/H+ antiporter NhaA [Motiliproteus sp. MSK22-1]OMH33979.1 Na+/H+ antiporter NhaA [Motiliproteus sp. MSK22-1]
MTLIKTPLEKSFEKLYSPFQNFIRDQTTSSMILIVCVIIALVIANSPFYQHYASLVELPLGVVAGDWSFSMGARHWINDGLMAYFFFLLGLEIKREVLVGEIRELNRLVPVAAAAFGGMLVPAMIYSAFNIATNTAQGWGIPMATDTAFAVGILALLGHRIPRAAFAFLTALAIIDDLGAILVIAIFYSETISVVHLQISMLLLLSLVVCNLLGIRKASVYLLVGGLVWVAMLGSGVHSTVAGILVAVTVPARPKKGPGWFINRVQKLVRQFERLETEKDDDTPILGEEEQHAVVEGVKDAAEKATTPLRRWERVLEQPIALFVLPVFALANAGIPIDTTLLSGLGTEPLALGIIMGLVVGKGIGIPLFCWFTIRLKLGQLPSSLKMQHVIGLGLLGGMGFTMSIFISGLGFTDDHQSLLIAKMAILVASVLAGVGGYLWLRFRT